MKSDRDKLIDNLVEICTDEMHIACDIEQWGCRCDDVAHDIRPAIESQLDDYDIIERGFVPVRRAIEEE